MRMPCMLIGLILALSPALGAVELYRYTDERGVIHFTDNFIEIPASQRPKVEMITQPAETDTDLPEVQTVPDRAEETPAPVEAAESDVPEAEAGDQGSGAAVEAAQAQPQFETLIRTKADLDQIYAALATEKEALEKEQQTLKSVESIRTFQNKVNLFNQRLADYERQRQAFQIQADAYNQFVSK